MSLLKDIEENGKHKYLTPTQEELNDFIKLIKEDSDDKEIVPMLKLGKHYINVETDEEYEEYVRLLKIYNETFLSKGKEAANDAINEQLNNG